jgi:glycosyltransferase involved in cell wall biosynthesis
MEKQRIAVIFSTFGPYHVARLNALSRRADVIAVEVSAVNRVYGWNKGGQGLNARHVTLLEKDAESSRQSSLIQERLSAFFAEHKPDVVAIPGWYTVGALSALLWCVRNGVPGILLSDSQAHDRPRNRLVEAIKARIVRLYSAALVGGRSHIDYLAALGFDRRHCHVGFDVVDNRHFSQSSSPPSPARAEQFLLVSRLVSKKNLVRFLEAYRGYLAEEDGKGWPLVVAGDGPLRKELEDLSVRLGIADRITWLGFVQYGQLPAVYASAGALVLPSVSEQWGLVVNEAMAAGLPVLVSERCGSAFELVRNGENGFTFDPSSTEAMKKALKEISADPQRRLRMGERSKAVISGWDVDLFADNLLAAVDGALESKGKRFSVLDRWLLGAALLAHPDKSEMEQKGAP